MKNINSDSIKISVVVPCFNAEKYIDECLKSLLNQTFKDFEIICVNDGSNDSTLEKLKKYNVEIINQENKGAAGAKNAGLKHAKGEYVTFVDCDDWINPRYLEKLYQAITENYCDIAISVMIRKRPNFEKYRLNFQEEKIYENLQEKLDICNIPKCCYICGKLFKKSLIENKPIKEGVFYEDVLWLPDIIKEADKIITVPDSIYYYRVNNSSIVKSVQSIQKQFDNYRAKSKIIEFYENNNLKLSEKNKHLTKYIYYFLKTPILKVKEYKNIETTLLFGFLPILKKKSKKYYYKFKSARKNFFIRYLDNHIYINFFKIHLGFKVKNKFKYIESKEYGLNKEQRKEKLIVSLTSFPARINMVHKTINTLLNQTLKPDKVILWLASEQFNNIELPKDLLKLQELGLEIKYCENIKSYKKLIPSLREFPNDIIITADDDLYYQRDWLESLYKTHLKYPNCICTRRACEVINKGNYFTITPHYLNTNYKPSFNNQLMGGAGTLFPPDTLYKDIFNIEKIKSLIPTYDDIYFWAMAILKGTKIALVENKDLSLYNVEDTQSVALCKINNDNVSINPKEAFNKVFEEYPRIINLIKRK